MIRESDPSRDTGFTSKMSEAMVDGGDEKTVASEITAPVAEI